MKYNCIFNEKKACNDCGQCDICDLDSKKTCNNCGRCLEMDGVDIKAVKIDEINEEERQLEANSLKVEDLALELSEYDDAYLQEHVDELSENEEVWEFIDDIDGLSEVLEEESRYKNTVRELYPGLVYIDKNMIK